MSDGFWGFLSNSDNQATLGWIGAGIAAVATAAWAVIRFLAGKGPGDSVPSVKADNKSVAIARDNNNSPINIDTRQSGKR